MTTLVRGGTGKTGSRVGPGLLTFADIVAELSRSIGRDVEYLPITAAGHPRAAAGVWSLSGSGGVR